MRHILVLVIGSIATLAIAADPDPSRIRPAGTKSDDARLGPFKTLNDYFPFKVPESREAWESRRTEVRQQLLVALGLWPMPEKSPLHPVIHGKIDRDDYTVEKVYFASMPGHYVSGNLYRPKGRDGKVPGILCPHGHWANGRFYDAGAANGEKQIKSKAEERIEGARYPLQARCAMLARLGCVVFHYDMVGVADSKAIPHAAGFADVAGELRLQSAMGLQSWNSIRALDFLTSLPDVDSRRIGVTGASGGGTQTFILGAIDDRPAVAFPAVMVSTAMQGGCVCENVSYLRIGTGNVEFAAMFAPKPLAMSAADDWTKEIESKGLPELKALYKLFDSENAIEARCWREFPHNYNQPAREMMYNWFNKHLNLGHKGPIVEAPFVPIPPTQLSVYDGDHPVAKDALDVTRLREKMSEASDRQLEALMPKDAAGVAELRRVTGTAFRAMIGGGLPNSEQLMLHGAMREEKLGDVRLHKAIIGRKGEGDRIPLLGVIPPDFDGTVLIWVHPAGKSSLFENGNLTVTAKAVLAKKSAILAMDMLYVGEQSGAVRPIDKRYAGYTYGYNRPLFAERVRDILTCIAMARHGIHAKRVYLVGWNDAGPPALMAASIAEKSVDRVCADLNQFRFESVKSADDPMMLPGAVKYGGLPVMAALCSPTELFMHNHKGTSTGNWTKATYAAMGATERVSRQPEPASPAKIIEWLLR
jgi:dienelactone hydrolase